MNMTTIQPKRPLDPPVGKPVPIVVAGMRALARQGDILDGIRCDLGSKLTELWGKVQTRRQLTSRYVSLHPESIGEAQWREQQARVGAAISAGQPLPPDSDWSAADYAEAAQGERDAISRAIQALNPEIAAGLAEVTKSFVYYSIPDLQNLEQQDVDRYHEYGLPYSVSDLVLSLRDSVDFVRRSTDAQEEVLEAAAQ